MRSVCKLAVCLSFFVCASAFGQAVVLDQGQTAFSLNYQHTFVRYHIRSDGTRNDIGHIMAYAIRPEVNYGLTDRITIDADVAFPAGKYIGARVHGRLDDGNFHGTLQDFHVGVRVNAIMQPLVLTPFAQLTFPSHNYQLEGHTATGKGKFEYTGGVYAGRELAPLVRNAYIEVMASHTIVQRTTIATSSQRLNRTNGSLEVGYFLTPTLTVRAFSNGLRTHGGWALPAPLTTAEELAEHDRFGKSRDIQIGGAVSYALRNGVEIYGGYFKTQWGRSAHAMAGPILGMVWTPRTRQSWLARMRARPTLLLAERID